MFMPPEEIPIEGPIEAKIAWAEDRCQEAKDLLFRDNGIVEHLGRLREAIHASHTVMAEVGLADK